MVVKVVPAPANKAVGNKAAANAPASKVRVAVNAPANKVSIINAPANKVADNKGANAPANKVAVSAPVNKGPVNAPANQPRHHKKPVASHLKN